MGRVCFVNARKLGIATLSVLAMLALSGCAATNSQHAWENVHGGQLIGNIYTGDDHI